MDRPLTSPRDHWHVVYGDGTGAEERLMDRPVIDLDDCVTAITDRLTSRR